MSRIGISPNSFESSLEIVCFPTPGVPEIIIFRYLTPCYYIFREFCIPTTLKDYFKNNH